MTTKRSTNTQTNHTLNLIIALSYNQKLHAVVIIQLTTVTYRVAQKSKPLSRIIIKSY